MNIILFDTEARQNLFPLASTRAIADVRLGILTIKERWGKMLEADVFILTDFYLQSLYQLLTDGEYVFIDACVIPNTELVQRIINLTAGEAIEDENGLIAGRAFIDVLPSVNDLPSLFKNISSTALVKRLSFLFELFQWNAEMIELDFRLITKGRRSAALNDTVRISGSSDIFIEEGAAIDHSVLNASAGSIYIGKNATVMEGCLIRGPFALCDGSVLKMGTKIYGATTIGPYSTGGGEIKNSIITGYSNKGHDGYLGDSVIGEWCNLGAGTTNSNVKNTGSAVRLWNYSASQYLPAASKCGVIMGDYSRTAINSSINTGSVFGVCCNVFGTGLLPKFIPDFTWGSAPENRYDFEKAITGIANWKQMKNKTISSHEKQVLKHIFDRYNNNEKV